MKIIFPYLALFAFISACFGLLSFGASHGGKYLLFVGTYTDVDGKDSGSKGIYSFDFDGASGKLESLGVAAETTSPSFLAAAPGGKFLYALNETRDYKGEASGGVTAFSIISKTGKLAEINKSRHAAPILATSHSTRLAGTCSWPTTRGEMSRCFPCPLTGI